MRIKLSIILIILLTNILSFSYAQKISQTIRGQIIDIDSKSCLSDVHVLITNDKDSLGTITDRSGFFEFTTVSIGSFNLFASIVGYESKYLKSLTLNAGKECIALIELKQSVTELPETIVKAHNRTYSSLNDMTTVSSRIINFEAAQRLPVSFSDPSRIVLNYAGIISNNDESNNIIIRGNSPKNILWRLEGVEIPNPSHFTDQGGAGGSVCILNENLLQNSEFLTSAFSAEYGNALSGVFDINYRKGNKNVREHSFQLGFLGVDFSSEGPFKKGSSATYLIGYRFSTVNFLVKSGLIQNADVHPSYQDLSFNLNLPTSKLGMFNIYGSGGISNLKKTYSLSTDVFKSKLGIIGLTNKYIFNEKAYIKTTVSYTTNNNILNHTEEGYFSPQSQNDYKQSSFNISTLVNKKYNAKHLLRIGFTIRDINYTYFNELIDYRYIDTTDNFKLLRTIFNDDNGRTNTLQSFASWKFTINNNLSIISGIHYIHLFLNNHYSIEPRLGLKWTINQNQILSFGAGLHSKIEPLPTYLGFGYQTDSIHNNQNLDLSKALHIILGYDYFFNENLHLKFEIYFQQLFNIPIGIHDKYYSVLNIENIVDGVLLTNNGLGRNYGIELSFEKDFSKNYYFIINASLYNSLFSQNDNNYKNTRYNGNYTSNIIFGKEFKLNINKNNRLGISFTSKLFGGQREFPIDMELTSLSSKIRYDYSKGYSTQLSDYFRIDLSIYLKLNHSKSSSRIRLDIQNLTNRQNELNKYFDKYDNQIKSIKQLGLIPVLSYKIEF